MRALWGHFFLGQNYSSVRLKPHDVFCCLQHLTESVLSSLLPGA